MLLQVDQPSLAEEQIGDIRVVKVNLPELLDESTIQEISARLHQLAEQTNGLRLVLNLDAVERLSTRMLGTFIALHKILTRSGGRLVLCGIDRQLLEIFAILKLPELLCICREEQEALQAF
jgi:anti-sigma B factor antagonist